MSIRRSSGFSGTCRRRGMKCPDPSNNSLQKVLPLLLDVHKAPSDLDSVQTKTLRYPGTRYGAHLTN
jgi:hypothetical protein